MAVKFSNNASATLAASINTTVTTIVVSTGQGSLFPSLGASDFFYATLVDASNNIEIVKVTARVSDTLTVVRGQDGTAGRSYTAGDRIELRPVAAALNAIQDYTPSGSISSDTVQEAIAELDAEKAPLASPALTGIPTAPTAAPGTSTTQLATTAFVQNVAGSLGTLSSQNANSVAITGGSISGVSVNGTTTTQATGDNTTNLASTAFVQAATPYASQTVKGMVRAYVSGTTLYIFTTA